MNTKTQVACAWSGIIALVLILIGTVTADFIPPPHADDSARQLANFYADHHSRIRLGLLLFMMGNVGWATLSAVVSLQIARIEGKRPVLAIAQAIVAATNLTLLMLFTMLLLGAAFRPGEIPATTTQTIHDIAWFMAFLPVSSFMLQTGICAVAVFRDVKEEVFPRWLGYFNAWITLLLFPGALLVFFKSGAFSYHGLFVFWVPFAAVGAWVAVMAWATRRAALAEAAAV
ncbi:MAG: hypothetical protein QOF76_1802 [Solirubrobacteraceae bacterium]|jgi:hypothetical protein|nr:hypothetical protein [Solirubrobacteraceae bacterium]